MVFMRVVKLNVMMEVVTCLYWAMTSPLILGQTQLLNVDAEYLANVIHEQIRDPQKVAFLCTDNASPMVLARRLLISKPGFEHIIGFR
jgi:hypothetical protein